ncbi:MAG: nucleotide exchange factor GrpE [bacterium]|nr:nucleotide exchange factor GrpE [bacterium]
MTKRRHDDSGSQSEREEAAGAGGPAADGSDGTDRYDEFDAQGPDGADGIEPAAADQPTLEDTLRRERDDAQDKWLRAMAEMDNLRKRTRREVADARRFAQADAVRGFLDVLDNLERALQSSAGAADTGAPDPFREGIELIRQKIRSVLQDQGITQIEALGLHLDPLVHEAVGQLPREGGEPGTIIEVAQAGYRLGELVLRPARVIICA